MRPACMEWITRMAGSWTRTMCSLPVWNGMVIGLLNKFKGAGISRIGLAAETGGK